MIFLNLKRYVYEKMNQSSMLTSKFFSYDPGFQTNFIPSSSNYCWLNEQSPFVPFLLLMWIYSVVFFIGCVIWRNYGRVSWSNLNDMENLLEELSNKSIEERNEFQKKYYLQINLLSNQFRIQAYQKLLENN